MKFQIKEILHTDTWPIRHRVMWPEKKMDYIKLVNDVSGKHYGLFAGNKLVSVVSLFIVGDKAQFRKFATLEEEQGKGFGSALLQHVIKEVSKEHDRKMLWCNARKDKTYFYESFGMRKTNKQFTKGGIDFIIMEKQL